MINIPEIHPISDLARDAKALIERARQRQEPIVITQRGRDAAVLVPIELYRRMQARSLVHMPNVRFVNPEDEKKFPVELSVIEPADQQPTKSSFDKPHGSL